MATPGDGTTPYESTGAGGKFRKRPFRRSIQATPYSRPPTAARNDNPSMLKKLVNPASRLIYAGAHRLFDVFRKNLPPLSVNPPEIKEEPQNVLQKEGHSGNSGSISAPTGISELEQMLQQKTFTRYEIERLTSVLHSKTTTPLSDESLEQHGDKRDNLHATISTPIVTSRVLKEEIASPAELAKCYMGSRPTIQAPTQDLNLFSRTPVTPVTHTVASSLRNLDNGFVTPRSRGRSAMYTMARRPYSGSPSASSQQGMKSDYDHSTALVTSQGHERRMALKRRSSVLDDDIGSSSPLRRIRQKANLLSQRDKKELGYPVFQQPDGSGQTLLLKNEPDPKALGASVPTKSTQTANKILQQLEKLSPRGNASVSTLAGMRDKSSNELRLDMLHGQALKSLEKVNSPKVVVSRHDLQKPVVPELTLHSKNKSEENGLRKQPATHNILTSVNGDMTVRDTLKSKAPTVGISDLPLKVTKEPQRKHAFQMSAPEDSFEMDDDDDDIHENGHVLPLEEYNNPDTSAADIIKTTASPKASGSPKFDENNKPMFPEVSKLPEQVKLKEAEKDVSTQKTDFNEQGLRFKIPVSSSSVTTTQSTLQMEKMAPVKVPPLPLSSNELSEKANASSDPKEINPISVFNSDAKNDDVKFPVSDKGENGNGLFSFGTSDKNLSTPNTPPASNPPAFPSWAVSPDSTTTATIISTTATPASVSSTSVPPQAFSFVPAVSTASNASVAESVSTSSSTSSPFAITTFSTTTTTTGSGLFSFSSPVAATSTTTAAGSGGVGFSSPAAATSTTFVGFSSPAAASSTATATNTTTSGNSLFGFSAPAAVTSTITATKTSPFGFSAPAAATSSTTTTETSPFGFSAPAAATSNTAATTTTTAGSSPFGFSAPAATTSTTTTTSTVGASPFGFGAPVAATSTSTASGISPFGFSAPTATSTTTISSGSGLFSFSSPAAATSTTATTTAGSGLFSFSSPSAATPTTTTTTTGSSLFGLNSSTAATSTTTSQSHGSFNITNGFQASTHASSTSTLFGSSSPAFGSSPIFGNSPVGPTSETKSVNSTSGPTTSIFGSTWQQPQNASPFGSTPSSSVFTFGASSTPAPSFMTAGASTSSFGGPSVFGNTTPVFGAGAATSANNNNNGDQMNMEDSMAEDSMQTNSHVSPFGQAPVGAPGFMFGSATPTPTRPVASFSFGGQQTQPPPPQNPFQSSSVEFNGGGGSFSLGSGGEKSNRRIVRVNKSKNRKK